MKLEVLGDKKNLFPDMIETLKSTEVLSNEGFSVMVYCNDDPLMAKRLENVGASAIMPLAAPIGSGLGILNKTNIRIIRNQTKLPLIVDAGLGQASDATIAMEVCVKPAALIIIPSKFFLASWILVTISPSILD